MALNGICVTPSLITGIRAAEDLGNHGAQSLIISNSRQGIMIIIYICIILCKALLSPLSHLLLTRICEISRKNTIKILISQKRKLKELENLMAGENNSSK